MASEAQKRAVQKYDAKNTRQYHLKLNRTTDADIIKRLEQLSGTDGGMQGYIKQLIRDDMNRIRSQNGSQNENGQAGTVDE